MIATVSPSLIRGTIPVPASKSAMQRALAAALIRKGKTILHNPGHSADDLAALSCIRALGAVVNSEGDQWTIDSQGVQPTGDAIDCGESGLSTRMFTPIAALSEQPLRITGAGSLVNRPMHFFEEVLPALGVHVHTNQGCLPIELQGPMRPASITVEGSLSSQFLTGMLMAYAGAGAKDVCIEVRDLKSRPYIDLTIEVMRKFGLPVPHHDAYRSFCFSGDGQVHAPEPLEYSVEGDWSSASFWFVAAAIAGKLELSGLNPASSQADMAIEGICRQAGMDIQYRQGTYQIARGLPGRLEFDATDCPDLFPPLVALASHVAGESVVYGAKRLAFKESDRAQTLKHEFGKLGVAIELEGDRMHIRGGGEMRGGEVSSHGDHRIAMALAVAALGAKEPVRITGAEAVRKSYPDFWRDLQSVGAVLSLTT